MNEREKKIEAENQISAAVKSEVLVEKVREIELAKAEKARGGEVDSAKLDKNNTSKILKERRELTAPMSETDAKKNMRERSRRNFLIGGATAFLGVFGWRMLPDETKQNIYRRAFEFNERVSQASYSPKRLAPEFARESVGDLRVNGGEGMSDGFNPETWRLQVVGLTNPKQFAQYTADISYETPMNNENEMKETDRQHRTGGDAKENPNAPEMPPATMDRAAASQMPMPGLLLTLDDIKSLPRVEMTTELKCIEGWSVVVNWAGARFSDFIQRFQPATRDGGQPDLNRPQDLLPYVSMVTPDGGYYVGWDMPSILHPQTLLAYEMNGAPLTIEHGAPLRLVSATKYGIKQIKRIGRIGFTAERPADYWAERGYDWYAGH